MKTTFKSIGIVALALALVVCFAIDGIWVYVKFFAPEETVVNTFAFDQLTTVPLSEDEEAETAYVIEVKYYTNDNENGLEAIEIQFNNYANKTKSALYSYGVQLVMKETSTASSLSFSKSLYKGSTYSVYDYDESGFGGSTYGAWWHNYYYSAWCSYYCSNGTYSFYESDDQFDSFTISSTSAFADDGFYISMTNDDDIYRISFRGDIYQNEDNHHSSSNYTKYKSLYKSEKKWLNLVQHNYYYEYYYSYNIYYFIGQIYSMVQSTAIGTDSQHWIKLDGDMFSYEKYNGTKYEPIGTDTLSTEITTINQLFGGIYVEKVADGLSTATQSKFGAVNGSAQYDNGLGDTDGDGESDTITEYFYGKSIITCDTYDFEYVNLAGNFYEAKLSQTFINTYLSSSGTIVLSVQIDLDVLKKNNITFYGFSSNSGLDNFTVYECYTFTTSNGEKIKTEVGYA